MTPPKCKSHPRTDMEPDLDGEFWRCWLCGRRQDMKPSEIWELKREREIAREMSE